ncbi:hypothetical protein CB0940_02303 [Cercospora beticola]|uniref:GH16 domain-containing protein n=1 Tax=Cercospora beticola TaxID=122368 RepID=A0A2G5I252_CERBT|nr:hypothetical protein CB0940_02303 [Cercospora beticola]PIA98859.1 hypothetical protein CB0940_02303 [Cercospora beticola]WPA99424.1 hypothetical protein RHO25_004041 [Cercospora beticola]CAK1362455.1 unnamed protein product [Cercospora beticola]
MRFPAQTLLLLFSQLLLLLPSATIAAKCACGYTTSKGAFFTDALETDFFHVRDLARDTDSAWIPQAYNVTPENANGPYGKASQIENVITNPVRGGRDVWDGEGMNGGDPGLQLWTRSALIPSRDDDDHDDEHEGRGGDSKMMIPMSEIVSSRTDILYGSFRIALKPTNINGTCGAFFFYFNDSTEIDMEFLSRQTSSFTSTSTNENRNNSSSSSSVNLVIQSPQSAKQGYASGPDFILKSLPFDPTMGFNEFRFDWFPSHVEFFANSVLLQRMEANVPRGQPGALHVSHWSNGNEGWSGGPPERDAVLMVGYVKAYFNSSSGEEGWRERCEKADEGEREVCKVEDQVVPPDPGAGNGETVFLTEQGGSGSGGGGEEPKEGGAGGKSFPEAWWKAFVLSVVVLLLDVAV